MKHPNRSKITLLIMMLFWLVLGAALIGVMFFLPAGTFNYWQAWVFLALIMIPTCFIGFYLFKKDPDAAQRRLKRKEKDPRQQLLINLSGAVLTPVFLLPGFDHRWGWSSVPVWVVILADLLVLLGFAIFFMVMRENSYASRVVEVEQEQPVITTGPYAIVRHPMYVGQMLMLIATPLALGSYWAVIPALGVIPILAARIIGEEKMLVNELAGYQEYIEKVKYRLLPGIW